MRFLVRRIKMDNYPNRGDVMWILFESGNIARPCLVLTESQMEDIMGQVKEQNQAHSEELASGT